MSALEIAAQKLVRELTDSRCFRPDGTVGDAEAVHQILDVPFLYVCMLDLTTMTHCYANSRLTQRAGIAPGWLQEDEVHSVGLTVDPLSMQRMLSELDRFASGSVTPQTGIMTLVCEEDEFSGALCNDLAAVVARSTEGVNTFYAHFFCEIDQMDLVKAFAAFELRNLTERQTETLLRLLKGASYNEIAEEMGITCKTLEKHVHAVYEATRCQNQAALIHACQSV